MSSNSSWKPDRGYAYQDKPSLDSLSPLELLTAPSYSNPLPQVSHNLRQSVEIDYFLGPFCFPVPTNCHSLEGWDHAISYDHCLPGTDHILSQSIEMDQSSEPSKFYAEALNSPDFHTTTSQDCSFSPVKTEMPVVVKPKTRGRKPKEGLRIFRCSECPKEFGRRFNLEQHEKTHSNYKPFKCNYGDCHKAFIRRADLDRHFRTHTGQLPFACLVSGCTEFFGRTESRQNHCIKVHKLNEEEIRYINKENKLKSRNLKLKKMVPRSQPY